MILRSGWFKQNGENVFLVTVTKKKGKYMEEGKRGRPLKFSRRHMLELKKIWNGERADNRHLQNHWYQTYSFGVLKRYHEKYPIENFKFLYKDEIHWKQTIFTELGRTNEFLCQYYSEQEADEYIINLAKEICLLAKNENNKTTSRLVERLIREDRKELNERLKEDTSN